MTPEGLEPSQEGQGDNVDSSFEADLQLLLKSPLGRVFVSVLFSVYGFVHFLKGDQIGAFYMLENAKMHRDII